MKAKKTNKIRKAAEAAARKRFIWQGYGSTVNLFTKDVFNKGVSVNCYCGETVEQGFEECDATNFTYDGTTYQIIIYSAPCKTCNTPVYVAVYEI